MASRTRLALRLFLVGFKGQRAILHARGGEPGDEATKTHLYWCMKNAGGDPTELRRLIMNISQHYQVMTCLHVRTSLHHCRLFYLCMHIHVHVSCLTISQGKHVGCCDSSPCQHPNYSPSKIVLMILLLLKRMRRHCSKHRSTVMLNHTAGYHFMNVHGICTLYMCQHAYTWSFVLVSMLLVSQCRDTFWVESFNHQLLMYLPKRIHFGTTTFLMRMNLALLDWVRSTDT